MEKLHALPFALRVVQTGLPLHHDGEDTGDHTEEGNPFYQGRSKDHVGADISGYLGLAGNGFQGTFTDLSHANTGAKSSDPGTYGASG